MALFFPLRSAAKIGHSDGGRRNDFKFTLLSLGSGSSRITYERAFSQKHSGEVTVGLIGAGWDFLNHTRSKGLLLKLAYKWCLIPMESSDSWLEGFYVKPEFVWAQFLYGKSQPDRMAPPSNPEETNQMALLAEGGYQFLFDWFVFDIYAGLGPSFGTGNSNNYYHSFMLFPADGRLAFTAGFRVGVAF
ncbi:MAG: hypothetical protein J6T88_07300 [Bacteroidales bacterium]|nr:hypothetical protein [Bacteroidales bacterium]